MQTTNINYRPFIILLFVSGIFLSCYKDEPKATKQNFFSNEIGLIDTMSFFNPPSNTIHIDPTAADNAEADGSIEKPFNAFTNFKFTENTIYALKRGTAITTDYINIDVDGVTLCSYGSSDKRPLINSTASSQHAILTHWKGPSNITIRDIEVFGPDANSCIRFGGAGRNLKVINCVLHGAYWEFRSIEAYEVLVLNTEMYHANDDGMFIQLCNDVEISNCYVHDVNQNWQPPSTPEGDAAGDGIQLDKCNHWHIHHNYIDRSTTGNKFCFISNNPDQYDGIFEYNWCLGPKVNGSGVYLHDGNGIVVRYNYIESPGGSPVYTHGNNVLIHHNIFKDIASPVYTSADSRIYNNLIDGFITAFMGGDLEVRNNILVPNREEFWIYHVEHVNASNNILANSEDQEGIIGGNPAFVNIGNLNYHLTKNSDCIDAGVDVGINYDYDGIEIPQGSAPDIGPYEYVE